MISYENFDLRIRADGDRFVVSARSGHQVANEPFEIDLLHSWELEELEPLGRDAVRKRGADLFDALIRGRIRNLYYQARGRLGSNGLAGLRIRMHFDPRDERLRPLVQLPWEIVLDRTADAGELLAFDPRRPIVRVIDSVEQTVDPDQGPVERVLLAVSNPDDSQRLTVDRECDEVTAALGRAEVVPHVLRNTTRASLLESIAEFEPQVVHFIGHGVFDETAGEGALVLEDDFGLEDRLFASTLASCFVGKPMPQLVILSACLTAYAGRGRVSGPFAAMAVALVAAGLPAVIAMQSEVLDRNAIRFTARLYRCLVRGGALEAAVAEARAAVGAGRLAKLDWAAPVLFVRAHLPPPFERDRRDPTSEWRRAIVQAIQDGHYAEAVRIARAIAVETLSSPDLEVLRQLLLDIFQSLANAPTNGFFDHIAWSRETVRTLLLQAGREAVTNPRKAMSTYDEIYSRFQGLSDASVQEQVGRALAGWIDVGWHTLRDPAVDAVADVILARRWRWLASAEDAARALLVKAEIRLEALQLDEALRMLDEVLAGEANAGQLVRARILRAKALAGMGRTAAALEQLNEVISSFDAEPADASNVYEAHAFEASLLESLGRGEDALRSLDRACSLLASMGGDASAPLLDARLAKAATAKRLGHREDAASEYRTVLERASLSATLARYAARARRALQRLRNGDDTHPGGAPHGE